MKKIKLLKKVLCNLGFDRQASMLDVLVKTSRILINQEDRESLSFKHEVSFLEEKFDQVCKDFGVNQNRIGSKELVDLIFKLYKDSVNLFLKNLSKQGLINPSIEVEDIYRLSGQNISTEDRNPANFYDAHLASSILVTVADLNILIHDIYHLISNNDSYKKFNENSGKIDTFNEGLYNFLDFLDEDISAYLSDGVWDDKFEQGISILIKNIRSKPGMDIDALFDEKLKQIESDKYKEKSDISAFNKKMDFIRKIFNDLKENFSKKEFIFSRSRDYLEKIRLEKIKFFIEIFDTEKDPDKFSKQIISFEKETKSAFKALIDQFFLDMIELLSFDMETYENK